MYQPPPPAPTLVGPSRDTAAGSVYQPPPPAPTLVGPSRTTTTATGSVYTPPPSMTPPSRSTSTGSVYTPPSRSVDRPPVLTAPAGAVSDLAGIARALSVPALSFAVVMWFAWRRLSHAGRAGT